VLLVTINNDNAEVARWECSGILGKICEGRIGNQLRIKEEDIEVLNAEEVLDDNDEGLLDDDLEGSQIVREENLTQRPEKKSKFYVAEDDTQKQTMYKMKRKKGAVSGTKLARTMYRLKNFSSQKLAEKHGDALGAHARGQHQQAIAKLSEVASAAPIAPQVSVLYSGLAFFLSHMV
jgi:hypothetical protein